MSEDLPRDPLKSIADSLERIHGVLTEIAENIDWAASQLSEMNSTLDNCTITIGVTNQDKARAIRVLDVES